MIAFHDGFVPYATPMASGGWDGFLTGADRVALDSHPYLCFSAPNNDGLSYQAAKVRSYRSCAAADLVAAMLDVGQRLQHHPRAVWRLCRRRVESGDQRLRQVDQQRRERPALQRDVRRARRNDPAVRGNRQLSAVGRACPSAHRAALTRACRNGRTTAMPPRRASCSSLRDTWTRSGYVSI